MVKLLGALAPAKINLFLRVTGQRANGYHELDSVFLPLALSDRVGLAFRSAPDCAVQLRCDWPELGPAAQNLAVRAAYAFMEEFAIRGEVSIDLRKSIPAGAGLGGGSSDAATVLRLLAELVGVADADRLPALALSLGADVPFFLTAAPARVRGIGERIEPLRGFRPFALVVAAPPLTVSTAAVFAGLRSEDWSGPASAEALAAMAAGSITPGLLVNDLAAVAIKQWPLIAELKTMVEGCGATGASMTGSGGAVFGIFATPAAAETAAEQVRRRYPAVRVFATTTLSGP
jgi:4-diphosphocytidyl-2-C-methyl-D-erythritol kinase